MMHALDLPNDAASARREALLYYERIVEQSLAREAQRALALLAIHDQKLHTPRGCSPTIRPVTAPLRSAPARVFSVALAI